jgi:hypothetical protein
MHIACGAPAADPALLDAPIASLTVRGPHNSQGSKPPAPRAPRPAASLGPGRSLRQATVGIETALC